MANKRLSSARGAQAKSKARRRIKNPDAIAVDDSSSLKEIGEFVLSGFAGYAGTRLLARVVYTQLMKKWPKGSRHFSVLSTGAAFAGAWYATKYVKQLEKHRVPATVGAGIAALQSVIQTYVPKFGWIVSDYQPTIGSASQPLAVAAPQPPALMEPNIDTEDFSDEYGGGSEYGSEDEILNPVDPAADSEGAMVMPFPTEGADDDFFSLEN
jgi:hypothetical protein